MTETPVVDPLAIVAGPSSFVTLYEVTAAPSAAGTIITFTWLTDQSVQLSVRIWDSMYATAPAASLCYTATEGAAAAGRRSFQVTLGAPLGPSPGKVLNYEITSATAPPPTLRPQQGSVRMPGARSVSNGYDVPARFNQYGDGTRPAGGGGIGNWSSYTWARYNPKKTTYPTP